MAMELLNKVDFKYSMVACGVCASGVALYSAYKFGKYDSEERKNKQNVYETEKSVNEYLVFHYGSHSDILKWNFGPKDAFDFPRKCAELCCKMAPKKEDSSYRALDIGCSVGRSSFELCRHFDEVVGIDYSSAFVDMCNKLKDQGKVRYTMTTVGNLNDKLEAKVDDAIDRSRALFRQGDACRLPSTSRLGGAFHCVFAGNLICRLHNPGKFLADMQRYVEMGGILVITSPYSFSTEYTPKHNWLGGFKSVNGNDVTGFDGLRINLEANFDLVHEENIPFLIRETERKHQYTIAHATVWKRHT